MTAACGDFPRDAWLEVLLDQALAEDLGPGDASTACRCSSRS